jgi:hypothetical protein
MKRSDSLLLVAVLALTGASSVTAAQAAQFAWSVGSRAPGLDALALGMMWGWVAVLVTAVGCGLVGGYGALRSGVVRRLSILAFLALYCLALRVDNASLG